MHAVNRVLDRHGGDQDRARQDRLPTIPVMEGTEPNGERCAGDEEEIP
jgi:hypothetical protein